MSCLVSALHNETAKQSLHKHWYATTLNNLFNRKSLTGKKVALFPLQKHPQGTIVQSSLKTSAQWMRGTQSSIEALYTIIITISPLPTVLQTVSHLSDTLSPSFWRLLNVTFGNVVNHKMKWKQIRQLVCCHWKLKSKLKYLITITSLNCSDYHQLMILHVQATYPVLHLCCRNVSFVAITHTYCTCHLCFFFSFFSEISADVSLITFLRGVGEKRWKKNNKREVRRWVPTETTEFKHSTKKKKNNFENCFHICSLLHSLASLKRH